MFPWVSCAQACQIGSHTAATNPSRALFLSPKGRLKRLTRKRGETNLNRAIIVFESEVGCEHFEVVSLENKFKQQWEQAAHFPCWIMRPSLLPAELIAMLASENWLGGGAVHAFDVKQRSSVMRSSTYVLDAMEQKEKGKKEHRHRQLTHKIVRFHSHELVQSAELDITLRVPSCSTLRMEPLKKVLIIDDGRRR